MRFRTALDAIAPYEAGKRISGVLKLASNENPLGPSPLAVEAVHAALADSHIYPDMVSAELRGRLAAIRGLEPKQIIVGNGSDEILVLSAAVLIEPGDVAVTARETFSQYAFAVRLFGGRVREVPLDRDGRFDLESLICGLDGTEKIVFICNPNNPTGTWYTHDRLKSFLSRISRETLIVLDEAYAEYADDPDFPDSSRLIAEFPNLLVTRTFSKIYGLAGLRIGYGMGSREIIDRMHRAKSPFNVNAASHAAALAALGDSDFIEKSREINRTGRLRLTKFCESIGFPVYRSQGNFICAEISRTGMNSTGVYSALAASGVTIRALESFGLPTRIRMTIGTPGQLDVLEAALLRLPRADGPSTEDR